MLAEGDSGRFGVCAVRSRGCTCGSGNNGNAPVGALGCMATFNPMNSFTVWLAAGLAALLTGCSSVEPDPITSIPQTSSFTSPAYEYRLSAGDGLKVVVLGQETISGDYEIDAAGNIDLSNIGIVPVGGLTLAEVKSRLSQKLSNGGIEDPQVSVLFDAKGSAPAS